MTGKQIVFPRLRLKVVADRAYCGRCGGLIGDMTNNGSVNLGRKRGHGWVYTTVRPWGGMGDGFWEFRLKRRRHVNPAVGGPSTAVGAIAGPRDIVVCPNARCGARQGVPSG